MQKDIVNFLINSPKGSVFIRSMDIFEVIKDANLLFKVLDDMVEEVREEMTDNASNYVKAGKKLIVHFFFPFILILKWCLCILFVISKFYISNFIHVKNDCMKIAHG